MAGFEDLMRTLGLAACAALALLLALRVGWGWRGRARHAPWHQLPRLRRLLQVVRALALLVFLAGALLLLFVLQRGSLFMPVPLQAVVAALLVGWVLLEVVLATRTPLPGRRWLRGVADLACLALGALGLLLVVAAIRAFAYPAVDGSVVLARVPFEGAWVAVGAGATAATNHHARIASQKYAADLAALCDDGRLFRGDGVHQEDSCTFGTPVLSPVDGTVVRAVDGHADGASRQVLPGNHVVIEIGDGRYVALAHFRQGSVRVQEGELVRAGQPIAEAGNSGNSDFAHLHLHVQDTADYDLDRSVALPWRFARMERRRYAWWTRVDNGFLLSNDQVRPSR